MRDACVLIVEDEVIIAWHLSNMMTAMGHRVCATVGTEAEAIEAARRYAPHLICMDLRLRDGGDGFRAAQAIRLESNVPIVFCTAHAGNETVARQLLSIGHAAVLGKPVDQAELKKIIESQLAPRPNA